MTLTGTFTALVTPFNTDGSVDYTALRELVRWQIENGVTGLVPVGTTGESPTLEFAEHIQVITATVEAAAGKAVIIAGTGANSTAEAIELTRAVLNAGVDATLQVTPYYNKPNAEGLYRHFLSIAELGLPVVLYNVPGRAGKEIPLDVVVRLASHPNVAAVKEAAGSVDRVSAIRNACELPVLSGDDSLALPMISVGACGVISVASNVIPKEMAALIRLALANDLAGARELHRVYYPLFRDLFIDTNPIPVKTALALMSRVGPTFRLPLCEPAESVRDQISRTLRSLNLL
ncbi:MAG TPA: 4-hydroxy-tetrahydrodipicolinate synthase [Kiritimatiellia bacterium]|nr:MAG: 4-hydroxy-tetrahydrodipicolinate synthase [Verrucomicrobia bacterium ADurb.Bin070]HPB11492.1 4-hydroxy-tetrahydrodipicolinate synthase [Kiritimatiellia bacterium]HQA39033.1 4-hydroxy-tetrahydrodipicolinate synthase [Kiritimatiellia bacterium]HQL51113.1 4-hydroxy-tetrahydrodipicolinate synthase [Kiritimatiellia bacterium]HQQ92764.1 4-hydroxy-tetrahydrodipicolinate synthase [Kiritimatiellia bacterium]